MNFSNFLVLSGWGFSSEILKPFVKALESRFDNRNIKLLETANNFYLNNIKSTANYISNFIHEDTIVIGWSLGGLLARAISYYFPEKIKGCVTLCSSPCFIAKDDFPGVDPEFFSGFYHKLSDSGIDQLKKEFLFLCAMGGPSPKQWIKSISPYFMSSQDFYLLHKRGLDLLSTDFRQETEKITTPSLHIIGEHDQLVPLANQACFQQSSTRLVEQAGHLLPLTHTDACLELISEYFEKQLDLND
jgi:pimeloyl-[acyl-carrier protein] methyl ester esterase